jgi:copper/silver efflux system protein
VACPSNEATADPTQHRSIYLDRAVAARAARHRLNDEQDLIQAIIEGAALRVRPIAMTVAVIIAGLLPIMWGTGSEIMRRIAAPMVGGTITAPLLSMLVIPAAYRVFGIKRHAIGIAAEQSLTLA